MCSSVLQKYVYHSYWTVVSNLMKYDDITFKAAVTCPKIQYYVKYYKYIFNVDIFYNV